MQLIQIGAPQQNKAATIREMFEKMSQREAEMIRAARERMNQSSARGN
jgi:hypothetical protein